MAWTSTYNRYNLNLESISISRTNFSLIYSLLQPEDVISLKFPKKKQQFGQVDLFTSLIDTQRLTRLRSLTFFGIDDVDFHAFVHNIKLDSLRSFTMRILKHDGRRLRTSIKALTKICSQVNMHELDLNIPTHYCDKLIWPAHCSIKRLKVYQSIPFNYLCQILKHSSQLETLIFSDDLISFFPRATSNSTFTLLFKQITSLTIEFCGIHMNVLESRLKFMPSLAQLKIYACNCSQSLLDGSRWEQFIETNLLYLNRFEFFFSHQFNGEVSLKAMERFIEPYRSPYWTHTKKWFVFLERPAHNRYSIRLFTMSIDLPSDECDIYPQKTYLSNIVEKERSRALIMDTVNTFKLKFDQELAHYFKKDASIINESFFPKVTKLHIHVSTQDITIEPEHIAMYIDFSKITEIELDWPSFQYNNKTKWINLSRLISMAVNLSSLRIACHFYFIDENFCKECLLPIIPSRIKKLTMSINSLDMWEAISEKCPNLILAKIDCNRKYTRRQIIDWCNENTDGLSYKIRSRAASIWFGTRQKQEPYIMETRSKRAKLS